MQGVSTFRLLLLVTIGWLTTLALEVVHDDLALKLFWNNVRLTFVSFLAYSAFLFTLDYTGHLVRIKPFYRFLFILPPLLTIPIIWTNDWHGLMLQDYTVYQAGAFLIPNRSLGPWYFFFTYYGYAIVLITYGLLFYRAVMFPDPYRIQSLLIVMAFLLVTLADVLHITQIIPGPSLAPLVDVIALLLIAWVLVGYRLFDLVPIAHHTLMQRMSDPLIVLDIQDRVIELNPAAYPLFTVVPDKIIGQSATDVLSLWHEWSDEWLSKTMESVEITELARKAQVLQPWDIRASRASAAFGVAIACTE